MRANNPLTCLFTQARASPQAEKSEQRRALLLLTQFQFLMAANSRFGVTALPEKPPRSDCLSPGPLNRTGPEPAPSAWGRAEFLRTAAHGKMALNSINGIIINSLVLFKMKARAEASAFVCASTGLPCSVRRVEAGRADQVLKRPGVGGSGDRRSFRAVSGTLY